MKKLLITFVLLYSQQLFAQSTDPKFEGKEILPIGVIEKIQSKELSEERLLNIYLPQGYHPDSSTRYPVIYVLDGSAHEDFPHIAGLAQFMNMYQLLPKSIVVGIANVNRYRDFTYPSNVKYDNKVNPANGGSPNFIKFLAEEVQPLIDQNFSVTEHRTIIGQSLGGLLATEILMKRPELFDDYIIVSPSLWWDKQRLVNSAEEYFNTNQNLKKRVFVSLGQEPKVMHKTADQLVGAIKNSGNPNLQCFYEPILDEDHATILHIAVYRAFKKLNSK